MFGTGHGCRPTRLNGLIAEHDFDGPPVRCVNFEFKHRPEITRFKSGRLILKKFAYRTVVGRKTKPVTPLALIRENGGGGDTTANGSAEKWIFRRRRNRPVGDRGDELVEGDFGLVPLDHFHKTREERRFLGWFD